MRYLLYFVFGPWYGQWAIFSCLVGAWFLLSRRLVQPIHGLKLRKIAGLALLASALVSSEWTVQLGHTPISPAHLKELYQLEKDAPDRPSILAEYSANKKLTELDFFFLKSKIKRASHPHFRRHLD